MTVFTRLGLPLLPPSVVCRGRLAGANIARKVIVAIGLVWCSGRIVQLSRVAGTNPPISFTHSKAKEKTWLSST